ncbi:hypothetical protein K431DRAFT_282416 [Polychaeton citri CBS 116435]|uniref:Rhodopsin domain-containing protein n=1 Tax=Polychaeton citri CBS 116435 TaxID=1314669 RepID=A0A9P4QD03_9PEZI|nr:hypothetical protein K431DRAFT_282416 [Polychaeton citri CBS 116435]
MVSLATESWIWWSIVLAVVISRYVSRYIALRSVRRYQTDEYLMLVALCFYTTLTVTLRIVAHTNSNLLPPGFDIDNLTSQGRRERIYGSKLILVVEQCQIATIWLAKGSLIIMYLRLTTVRRENIAVKILGVYIVVGFIVMEVLYFGVWCRPFSNYWALPTPNPQCDAATDHLITNAVFNLTSDVAMLAIGLPMFLRMQLAWNKKIPVIGVFSLGIFVVIAAILNKIYSFTEPFGSAWTYWYLRESSTAMIVANLPFVWTLWRKLTGIKSTSQAGPESSDPSKFVRSIRPQMPCNPRNGSVFISRQGRSSDDDSDFDLEMGFASGERKPNANSNMTFAEMLRAEGTHDGNDGKTINPFTHPALFYGRKEKTPPTTQSHVKDAVLRDSGELTTVRREPGSGASKQSTPSSSVFPPYSGSVKSAGSFV